MSIHQTCRQILTVSILIGFGLVAHGAELGPQCRALFQTQSRPGTASQYTVAEHDILRGNIVKLGHHFQAAKFEGESQIKLLQALGFRFTSSHMEVPEPGQIFYRLDRMIESLRVRHGLTEDQIYRPVRSFVGPGGEVRWLKATETVPAGFAAENVHLNTADYHKLRAEGLLPLAELTTVNGTISALEPFLHDVAHFGPMIRNPRLMVADRILAKSGYLKLTEMFEEYLTEVLVWTNSKYHGEIHQFLEKYGVDPTASGLKKATVLAHLKTLSEGSIDRLIGELIANRYRWYSPIGGASADMIFRRDSANRRLGLGTELYGLTYVLAIFPEYGNGGRYVENSLVGRPYFLGKRDLVLEEIASHMTQLQIMNNYRVERFFEDVANISSASPMLRQLLIDSDAYFFPPQLVRHLIR